MEEFVLFHQILNEADKGHDVTELLKELLNQEVIPHTGLTINTVLEIIRRFNFRTEVFRYDENKELIIESLDDFISNQNIDVEDFSETKRTFEQQGWTFRFIQPDNEPERKGITNSFN